MGARSSRPRSSKHGSAVPVVVLAGFLGAGKTTVLNHLLRHSGGRRFGVLVNDFGAINVDALLVSGRSASTLELSSGCICCVTDADGFTEVLGTLAGSGVDAIVVEASGIAEPKALIRMVLAARDARVAYGGLVYVADSANLASTLAEFPSVREHLAVADLILCNKADLVSDEELSTARGIVGEANVTAPVLSVVRGAVDPALFVDGSGATPVDDGPRQLTLGDLLADDGAADDGGARDDHLHDAFESVSVQSGASANPRLLAALLERPPARAYRIKGVVALDVDGYRDRAVEVHAVGGFVQVTTRPWHGPRETSLVMIGAGLDVEAAKAALDAVFAPAEPDDVNGILLLTRHLADG